MTDFDHQKWSFWLVAFVIGWILMMAAMFLGACAYQVGSTCDLNGRFAELLQTILASALAFAAGRVSK